MIDVRLLSARSGCCWVMSVEQRSRCYGATPPVASASQMPPTTPAAAPFLDAAVAAAAGRPAHAGVVHAPGRPQPARVPGRPRRGQHPRRDQASRSSRPRSPCNRCAATAWTPRCCTATSSCPPTPSGSASTSHPAPARWPSNRSARRATWTGSARSTRHAVRGRDGPAAGRRAAADVPLLAFAGAPFTVASYLIEGRPVATYEHTKALMHTDERLWHDADGAPRRARRRLHRRPARRRRRRVPAVRLVGRRSAAPTTTASCCPTRRRCSRAARKPSRARPASTSASAATTCSSRCTQPARRVIGLDWRTPIADARRRLGPDLVVQGNLDPALVLAGADVALAGAAAVLADNDGHPGHIFNLGHGVHPTPIPVCSRPSSITCTETHRTGAATT